MIRTHADGMGTFTFGGNFSVLGTNIGKQAGCLIAFTADGMRIKDKQKEHAVTKPVLAISAGPVSIQGGYQLILHPMHVKEGG